MDRSTEMQSPRSARPLTLALVGADFEENLGVGMIAAAAVQAGHRVAIHPFNEPRELNTIADRLVATQPDVVGLSMQFQHRAHEFVALARRLRVLGYRGHITCGGQYPTLADTEVLDPRNGLDSVVLHEGERTIVELLDAVAHARPLETIAGLSLPGAKGGALRTAPRALLEQLDELPFMMRYRRHAKHLGVPFIPLMGSRGCWGSCSYCSITSFYRDARAHGGGKTFRQRSPENLADEMAVLWHDAGGASIFCFHDDNFLLPRPSDTSARVRAIRARLDELGVGRVGLIGKCRPECLTTDLARELRELGVIRLYVGVENASGPGAEHLNRGAQAKRIHEALEACREAGIFVCYNLLVFEPDATLDDVRTNIAFIRAHANHPMNFCRAEPYHGTPLHRRLERDSNLGGSYLGWNYRIGDTRTEMLFRISSAVFRQRNFDPEGVANRYMGLGYSMKLLEVFHEGPQEVFNALQRRASDLTRGIATETADFLDEAVTLAASADFGDTDSLERRTALLGLRISAADGVWHRLLDDLYADMNTYATGNAKAPVRVRPPPRVVQLAKKMAVGMSLAMYGIATEACGSVVADPVPPDSGDVSVDHWVVDPAPVDVVVMDATADRFIADPPPPDAGRDVQDVQDVQDVLPDYPLVDPAPWDSGVPVGALEQDPAAPRRLALIDQWRSTTPEDTVRSRDLPLHSPPRIRLVSERTDDGIRVRVEGASASAVTTKWESNGEIRGAGLEITWLPRHDADQVSVAVRSRGGIAVLALRAREIG